MSVHNGKVSHEFVTLAAAAALRDAVHYGDARAARFSTNALTWSGVPVGELDSVCKLRDDLDAKVSTGAWTATANDLLGELQTSGVDVSGIPVGPAPQTIGAVWYWSRS